MAREYSWREGSRIMLDAQKAGEELQRLIVGGKVDPEIVLTTARPENSPLHDHFEWDDAEAAHTYRIDQAQHLIRCVKWIDVDSDNTEPVRMFISVPHTGDNKRDYVIVEDVQSDSEMMQRALEQCHRDLKALSRKYQEYEELHGILSGALLQLQAGLELAEASRQEAST